MDSIGFAPILEINKFIISFENITKEVSIHIGEINVSFCKDSFEALPKHLKIAQHFLFANINNNNNKGNLSDQSLTPVQTPTKIYSNKSQELDDIDLDTFNIPKEVINFSL